MRFNVRMQRVAAKVATYNITQNDKVFYLIGNADFQQKLRRSVFYKVSRYEYNEPALHLCCLPT